MSSPAENDQSSFYPHPEPDNKPVQNTDDQPTADLQFDRPGESSILPHNQPLTELNQRGSFDPAIRPGEADPYWIDEVPAEGGDSDQTGPEEEAEAGPSAWDITKAVIREIVETVVLTLVIFFLIQSVIRNFRVDGHSMDPNLHHGQYLVVDKISYRLPFDWRTPQRGDVVVFEPPTRPDDDFVKRVIAVPGDTIEIRQGQVFVNGDILPEPYLPRLDRFSMNARTVPEGHYFVMGDNRGNSNDSRHWGMLEVDKMVGRAWVSYWPPSTWGTIPNDTPTESATLAHFFSEWFGQAQAAPRE